MEKTLLEKAAKRQGISVPELLRRSVFSQVQGVQTAASRKRSMRNSASLDGRKEDVNGE
jgi:hypothetical protein